MFLTLCYALLTLFLERQRNRVSKLLKDNIHKGSVVFHYVEASHNPTLRSSVCSHPTSPLCDKNLNDISQKSLLKEGCKAATFLFPKQKVDLKNWAAPSFQCNLEASPQSYVTILVETVCVEARHSESSSNFEEAVKLEDYCIPKAWINEDVYALVGHSSIRDLSIIGTAFLNNKQLLAQNMEVKKIMTVDIDGISSQSRDFSQEVSTMTSPSLHSRTGEDVESPAHHLILANDDNLCMGPGDWCSGDIAEGLESVEFPLLESLDKEYYGGSNESLAEKVAIEFNLPLEEYEETDSDYEEGLSVVSNTSNEACAGSHSNSPLKGLIPVRPSCLPLRSTVTVFHSMLDGYCDEAGETMAATPDSPYVPSCDTTPSSGFHSDGTSLQNKPPNILIYTGENDSFCSHFIKLKKQVEKFVDKHCYVIYLLSETQILKNVWKENTSLLIVASESVSNNVSKEIYCFLNEGGKILVHCTDLSIPSKRVITECAPLPASKANVRYKSETLSVTSLGDFAFKVGEDLPDVKSLAFKCDTKEPVIIEVNAEQNGGRAILSQVCLFEDDDKNVQSGLKNVVLDILSNHLNIFCTLHSELQYTPAFLLSISQTARNEFLTMHQKIHGGDNKMTYKGTILHLVEDVDSALSASINYLPIVVCPSGSPKTDLPFDTQRYFSNLNTSRFGRVLVYSHVIPTTMTVVESLSYDGLVAIAHYQTEGKARGKNSWLSPEGCAMFSLHMSVPLNSNLGQKVSFLQHLISVSVIQGICDKRGYENINLKIKWPNDIYYGRDVKLGGVLMNSRIFGNEIRINIGVGINVANSKPTMCVNEVIRLHNSSTGSSIEELTVEEVIAQTLTSLEKLVNDFQKRGGEAVLPSYYSHWLHSNQEVTLGVTGETATVVDLDDYGYLRVRTKSGDVVSVQPDGNSFDMMKNLIVPKSI